MVRMKRLARRYMWWPRLDVEIEEVVKACPACQEGAKAPPSSQQASWSWPGGPWKRLHLDFAGPYLGKMFLVVVDAYSKYLDIIPMTEANSSRTISALRHLFSYFGLPEHIVTDNGSQFTSAEFQAFLNDNCIRHTTTAPCHPATNGLAERYVGEFKDKLSKMGDTGESLSTKLDRFLLTFRATPTALGKSPSELLMNRQPRLRLSNLRPKTNKHEVKVFADNLNNRNSFVLNQAVFARNFGKGNRWSHGKVVGIISPRNYNVQVGDVIWKRHEEQLRNRFVPSSSLEHNHSSFQHFPGSSLTFSAQEIPQSANPTSENPATTRDDRSSPSGIDSSSNVLQGRVAEATPSLRTASPSPLEDSHPVSPRRYPQRERKPPQRFY